MASRESQGTGGRRRSAGNKGPQRGPAARGSPGAGATAARSPSAPPSPSLLPPGGPSRSPSCGNFASGSQVAGGAGVGAGWGEGEKEEEEGSPGALDAVQESAATAGRSRTRAERGRRQAGPLARCAGRRPPGAASRPPCEPAGPSLLPSPPPSPAEAASAWSCREEGKVAGGCCPRRTPASESRIRPRWRRLGGGVSRAPASRNRLWAREMAQRCAPHHPRSGARAKLWRERGRNRRWEREFSARGKLSAGTHTSRPTAPRFTTATYAQLITHRATDTRTRFRPNRAIPEVRAFGSLDQACPPASNKSTVFVCCPCSPTVRCPQSETGRRGAALSLKSRGRDLEAEKWGGEIRHFSQLSGFIRSEFGVETRCLGDVSGCAQPFRRRGREKGGSDS